ncbi:MAG: bifunctional phosphoglucose/phosphomannose isomerase [Candidatus Paceibacterota bacterium]
MEDSIINFNKQFDYEPVIRNAEKLKENYEHFVLCGMGGSHLAAGIVKMQKPGVELYVHKDYDLPPYSDDFLKKSLLIASSHSGNTEEVLSFLRFALEKGYDTAVITTGGKLFEIAVAQQLPHIVMPNDGLQPRLAIGFSTLALLKIMKEEDLISTLKNVGRNIDSSKLKSEGDSLANSIGDKVPVIYASNQNLPIAYNWKIKFNETGKIPAFYNLFPELNHNEMQGFDDEKYSDKFHFIFLHDTNDNPRIEQRMKVLSTLFEEKGFVVTNLELSGQTAFEKVFSSLLIADWTALELAKIKGTDPQSVPLIEDFKKRLN